MKIDVYEKQNSEEKKGHTVSASVSILLCAVIPSILDISQHVSVYVGAPAGPHKRKANAGVFSSFSSVLLLHLPSADLALSLIARGARRSLSIVDREIEFCVPTT